ncbi:MAG: polyprenyl synthetase family protein [Spirochaetota bacterium]|nr:polyprenyl synthetase family protein [Spirochaetota bacterium]
MFNDFSKKYIPMIDQSIKDFFKNKKDNAEYPFIKDFYCDLEEFCLRKGKRLRPLVLLIAYQSYYRGEGITPDIIKLASILEIMHSMLLVQDDIIDKSKLRRGKKTLHIILFERYRDNTRNKNIGKDVALVLSDVLFANAIEIIADIKTDPRVKNEFLYYFAKTYELTAWGQILDSINSLPVEIDTESDAPMQISALKTAHYTILGPMLMGFILSGREDENEKKKISDFSLPLGLAFQVRDDILGVFGSEKKTGKTSDSDIIEGKLTLLIQNSLKNKRKREREKFLSIFSKGRKTKGEIDEIRNLIVKNGSLKKSKDMLFDLIEESREKLLKLNIGEKEKKIISGLIDLISNV